MDTLNPGLDENGNPVKDTLRASKMLMKQSEQEMYQHISKYQDQLNRAYQKKMDKILKENETAKERIAELSKRVSEKTKDLSKKRQELHDLRVQKNQEILDRVKETKDQIQGKYTYDRMLEIIKRVGKKLDASKNTERTKEGVRTLAVC